MATLTLRLFKKEQIGITRLEIIYFLEPNTMESLQ